MAVRHINILLLHTVAPIVSGCQLKDKLAHFGVSQEEMHERRQKFRALLLVLSQSLLPVCCQCIFCWAKILHLAAVVARNGPTERLSTHTPQNQYFPANAERMDVHCLESGCIGKYIPLGPRDFPRAWILHPSDLEISLGLRPRAISRASGCKIPALGKSLRPRGMYFQIHPSHPSSRQCTDTIQRKCDRTTIQD